MTDEDRPSEQSIPEPAADATPAPAPPAPPTPAPEAEATPAPPPAPAPQAYPGQADAEFRAKASKKLPAGILGILLGALGIHKFILGYTGAGITMLLVSILSFGFLSPIMWIIGLIEGIIYLTKSDEEFVATYVDGQKSWF
jgi:TM2 domain-containing membrane protein YozV